MKNKKATAGQLWGMMKYDLLGDGSLIGQWTNNHTDANKVMCEVARKKGNEDRDNLSGEYYIAWIEGKGGPVAGTLKIQSKNTHYSLEWIVSGKICLRGVGMAICAKQLLVFYWDGESITLPDLPTV